MLLKQSSQFLCCKFRDAAAAAFGTKPEQLSFIFAGKIMKDGDTLKMHNVKDGFTVHMVIKLSRTSTATPSSTATSDSPTGKLVAN